MLLAHLESATESSKRRGVSAATGTNVAVYEAGKAPLALRPPDPSNETPNDNNV